ncbi:MAG TPA: TolC family protein [Gemmataceae bacterium]|jgi:cobalt-zinc-cadmium efflux system outer membrane protein
MSIQAAQKAEQVLEAQYQDAVRQAIDKLDTAFIDVLEARQTVRALRAGWARLKTLEETIGDPAKKGRRPLEEIEAVSLERVNAELAIQRAEATLLQAHRALALLLRVPAEQAASLQLFGSLHDRAAPPPCLEELMRIALQARPDLNAYRLGMNRAAADLRRERAEAIDNLFLFCTPLNANDFSPLGKQSAYGWGLGLLLPVPLFDRNQGDIDRARVNVTQTHLERQDLERRIRNEVRYAATEYAASREVVRQYEQDMLPGADSLREEQSRLFVTGQTTLDSLLEARREHDEVVREYLEALVYHRRAMRRLNIAVGQCILP